MRPPLTICLLGSGLLVFALLVAGTRCAPQDPPVEPLVGLHERVTRGDVDDALLDELAELAADRGEVADEAARLLPVALLRARQDERSLHELVALRARFGTDREWALACASYTRAMLAEVGLDPGFYSSRSVCEEDVARFDELRSLATRLCALEARCEPTLEFLESARVQRPYWCGTGSSRLSLISGCFDDYDCTPSRADSLAEASSVD